MQGPHQHAKGSRSVDFRWPGLGPRLDGHSRPPLCLSRTSTSSVAVPGGESVSTLDVDCQAGAWHETPRRPALETGLITAWWGSTVRHFGWNAFKGGNMRKLLVVSASALLFALLLIDEASAQRRGVSRAPTDDGARRDETAWAGWGGPGGLDIALPPGVRGGGGVFQPE